jgi:hypothetical protein
MEAVGFQMNGAHLVVSDLHLLGIVVRIQFAPDLQAGGGARLTPDTPAAVLVLYRLR